MLSWLSSYLSAVFEMLRKVNPPRVWRLLIQNNNWTYVFRGLSPQSAENERPAILAIREDKEGQLMILAQDVPKSQ